MGDSARCQATTMSPTANPTFPTTLRTTLTTTTLQAQGSSGSSSIGGGSTQTYIIVILVAALILVVLVAAIKIRNLKQQADATVTGARAASHAPPGAFANAMYDDSGPPAANSGYMDVQGHDEENF